MKLTAKLVLVMSGVFLALLIADAVVQFRHDVKVYETNLRRDQQLIGRAVADLLANEWERAGREPALALLGRRRVGNRQVVLRGVRLDVAPGHPRAPRAGTRALARIRKGVEASVRIDDGGEDGSATLCTYVAVPLEAARLYAIEVSESLAPLAGFRRATVRRLVTLAGLLLVGCVAVVLGVGVGFVGRPLALLADQARRVGAGDRDGRVELAGRDELSELGAALNAMCDDLAATEGALRQETAARIRALERLRHTDRLRTVGRLAAGIAHELGTPLNVIGGRAQLLAERALDPADVRTGAEAIRAQARSMTKILRQLLDFARQRPPQRREVDLLALAGRVVELLAPTAARARARLTLDEAGEGAVTATVDAEQIEQVVVNVVMNAIQATPPGGGDVRVRVESAVARAPGAPDDPGRPIVRLSVQDEGHGIAPEHEEQLFEPFFTTKDVGKGTGLGLSIVFGIVKEHGGWIDVQSEPGRGSTFEVCLLREEGD